MKTVSTLHQSVSDRRQAHIQSPHDLRALHFILLGIGIRIEAVIASASSGLCPMLPSAQSRPPAEQLRCHISRPHRMAGCANSHRLVPDLAFWCHRFVGEIGKGRLIRATAALAPASMAMLQTVMRPSTRGPQWPIRQIQSHGRYRQRYHLADDCQNDVLGCHAWARSPSTVIRIFFAASGSMLRRQHMLDLGCANASRHQKHHVSPCASHHRQWSCPAGEPCSGPITWTMPWRMSFMAK